MLTEFYGLPQSEVSHMFRKKVAFLVALPCVNGLFLFPQRRACGCRSPEARFCGAQPSA